MTYCKIKTADAYPVSVAQIRRMRGNVDWFFASRAADIGTWGRLSTDGATAVAGTPTTYYLTSVMVDLTHYTGVMFGVVCDGSGAATWDVVLSMTDGATEDVTLTFTNPGSGEYSTGTCTPGSGNLRRCRPQVTVTRTSGTGSLSLRYVAMWGTGSTSGTDRGPAQGAPARAADLQTALDAVAVALRHPRPTIGWFGAHDMTVSSATAARWYHIMNKADDDETVTSSVSCNVTVYQASATAGKTWTITHSDNGGDSAARTFDTSGVDLYSEVDLPVAGTSYDTTTPWSGGKLDQSAQADGTRPSIRSVMLSIVPSGALRAALAPTKLPLPDWQIRTAEDTRAVGINDIAEYVHACTWYAGGNVSGGMVAGAGKAFTFSSKTEWFQGLIWAYNDRQSGSTCGSNTYQVAVRCSNGGASTGITCTLTVDGQSGTDTDTLAAGENYLVFDVAITGIDTTDYAVPVIVEMTLDASRAVTVYSVQVSRRGGAY